MTGFEPTVAVSRARRVLPGLLLSVLGLGCLVVLRPFLAPLAWAAILAYVSWPLYRRMRVPLHAFNATAACLMTLLVCSAVVLPVLWLLALIQGELLGAYRQLATSLSDKPEAIVGPLRRIPWWGEHWADSLQRYAADPSSIARELIGWMQGWTKELAAMLGSLVRNLGKLLIALLGLFFLYRDGTTLSAQARRVVRRFFDDRLDRYIEAAGTMVRAVLFGFVLTALAQGVIAGIGYWVVGLEASALLGALTGLLSAVPLLGTAIVWVPVGVWLLLQGHLWQGVVLLLWGALLVHPTDNVLRPLLISTASRVPFLIVLLGALGGLAAFGLIGAVLGPVLLGLAVAIWREWAATD